MVRFLQNIFRHNVFGQTVFRHAAPLGLSAAVLLSRVRTGIASVLRRDIMAARIETWIKRRPADATPHPADPAASGPPRADAAERAAPHKSPQASMQNFADLIASAVNPSMSRDERERVYGVVRQAVMRLHQGRDALAANPQVALQMHLVEETIRDLEADIARHNVLERMRRATETQAAEIVTGSGKQG